MFCKLCVFVSHKCFQCFFFVMQLIAFLLLWVQLLLDEPLVFVHRCSASYTALFTNGSFHSYCCQQRHVHDLSSQHAKTVKQTQKETIRYCNSFVDYI